MEHTISQGTILANVVEDRQRLVAMKTEIETQIERATAIIKNEMIGLGVDHVDIGDLSVSLSVREGRATLSKTLLVGLGVSLATLDKATTHGKDYTQLDIREKKAA